MRHCCDDASKRGRDWADSADTGDIEHQSINLSINYYGDDVGADDDGDDDCDDESYDDYDYGYGDDDGDDDYHYGYDDDDDDDDMAMKIHLSYSFKTNVLDDCDGDCDDDAFRRTRGLVLYRLGGPAGPDLGWSGPGGSYTQWRGQEPG